jgi:predicted transcriptional regulator of viral defense system
VYKTIRRSRNGISIAQLKAKTALDDRQLSNALYKLTKKGMIEAKSRGVYVKS